MSEVNSEHEIRIEKLAHGGQGIGRIEGKVCFVDGVIPGEVVRIRIDRDAKDYSVGRLIEIVDPSAHRVAARCPVYLECGGCQLQHMAYGHQLALKREVLLDAGRRIGGFEALIAATISSDEYGYRNKAQLPVQSLGHPVVGYFRTRSHEVVEHASCMINVDAINQALPVVKNRIAASRILGYDERSHRGRLRHVIIRAARAGSVHITYVTKDDDLPEALYAGLDAEVSNLTGVSHSINPDRTNRILGRVTSPVFGSEHLAERLRSCTFRYGPRSFFQVNTPAAEAMADEVVRALNLDGTQTVLDLYSGVGTFGLLIAGQAAAVVAIEENDEARRYAQENAERNGVTNWQQLPGRVEEYLPRVPASDVAIVDPPRKGLDPAVIDLIAAAGVKRIAYVSCDPATLARDVKRFIDRGYALGPFVLCDMFPQTYHIEALAMLER